MIPRLKQTVFMTIAFAVIAIICLASGGSQAISLFSGPAPYQELGEKLFTKNNQLELRAIYTSVKIDNLYGPFDKKVNYSTSTNRYGIETTTKSEALSYLFRLPDSDRLFRIDAYNIPTKEKLGEFSKAYEEYSNGIISEKPEPIEITGSFQHAGNKSSIQSVIFDVMPIPEEGLVLSDELLREAMISEGVNVDALSKVQLESAAPSYLEDYKYPNEQQLTRIAVLDYAFVADRLDSEPYMTYYVIFIGFILMCAAIAMVWISYSRWKKACEAQSLSLENHDAKDDLNRRAEDYVSGRSRFITSEAQRIFEGRKKENKSNNTMIIFGAVLTVAGIGMVIAEIEMISGVLIFMGLLVAVTALIRSKKIRPNLLLIEQELYMDLMIQGMTYEKLDEEMAQYDVASDAKSYSITENFVIQRGALGIIVVNLNRVLWAGGIFLAQNAKNMEKGAMLYDGVGDVNEKTKEGYSRVRSQYIVSYYGVTGEPIYDRRKKELKTITGDERSTKILLQELHETHPWIFMGREQMKYLNNENRPEAVEIWKRKRYEYTKNV